MGLTRLQETTSITKTGWKCLLLAVATLAAIACNGIADRQSAYPQHPGATEAASHGGL
ncbi:MAG TPA: hypothetical protein VIB78_13800 [Acidimicrobiia bacterium]|jgi:hypothetical protein